MSALLAGCRRDEPDPSLEAALVAASSPSARPQSSATPKPSLSPSVLYAMKLSPPRVPPQRLAFARGRLARVTNEALEIRRSDDLTVETTIALEGPRQVVALADGSILCLASSGVYRIPVGNTKPERYPRPSVFAQSFLMPDRARPDRLWVAHGFNNTVFGYDVVRQEEGDRPLLPVEQVVELDGFVQRGLTLIADGAFFYTSSEGFVHAFAGGKRRAIRGSSANVARLLAAKRVDQVWIARDDGNLELAQITDRLRAIASIRLESVPFDAAVNGGLVAVLLLRQPDDAPKSFAIEVYEREKSIVRESYELSIEAHEDWASRLLDNAEIALSSEPRRVAVGGSNELAVWAFDESPRRMALP